MRGSSDVLGFLAPLIACFVSNLVRNSKSSFHVLPSDLFQLFIFYIFTLRLFFYNFIFNI